MNRRDVWLRVRALLAAGLSPGDARARARARFGPASIADECRDARGIAFIDSCLRDIRYAIRTGRRTPTVTATVIGTLALGLGLSAAVFTIFNALVFRPEAVRDPDSLFSYSWSTPGRRPHRFTLREYDALRRENDVFSDVAARNFDLTTRIEGRGAEGQLVTGNFFHVLGVSAVLGRTLMPADAAAPGREPVVVLSYPAWQRIFAGDPSVIGRTIRVNGFRCDVVGVTPAGFRGLEAFLPVDFWAPLTLVAQLDPRQTGSPPDNPGGLEVIGRLKPGMSEARARAALGRWASRNAMDLPAGQQSLTVVLSPRGTSAPLSLNVLLGFSPYPASNRGMARAFARDPVRPIRQQRPSGDNSTELSTYGPDAEGVPEWLKESPGSS